MNKTHVIIVNRNGLSFLKDCIVDLQLQTVSYDLTIVDNDSRETGTKDYLMQMEKEGVRVVRNDQNQPLNHIWNEFAASSPNPYLCFLNNDVRIPSNFIEDSEAVFELEPRVGITCHASNNPKYQQTGPMKFAILNKNMRQGWDFTIRKELYSTIPEELHWFCGDDWIYKMVYQQGYEAAILLSSPIIHFQGKTSRREIDHSDLNIAKKYFSDDEKMHIPEYSLIKPQIDFISEAVVKTSTLK